MIPVVVDTDPGIDDALALLLAWGSPEIRVEAVTVVAGNVPLPAATRNLDRLLALCRPSPPPRIGLGAADPLARRLVTAEHFHGADGLGDLADWPPDPADPPPSAEARPPAPALIAGIAASLGPALTLVALGPLTNVALALEADATAVASIGRLVVMGGAVDVAGNVTPTAEFNVHVDPEAAARVLAAGMNLDLVPLDVTRRVALTRTALMAALARAPGTVADRIAAFTARAFRLAGERGAQGIALHDPLALGVAFEPGLVEWEAVHLVVGADGETRRGTGAPNCRIARSVDAPRFLRLFLSRLGGGAPA